MKAKSITILVCFGLNALSAIGPGADSAIAAAANSLIPVAADSAIATAGAPSILASAPATSIEIGSRLQVALFAGVSASGGPGRFHDLWTSTAGPEVRIQFSAEHAFFALATHSFTAIPDSADLPSLDMIDTRCGAGLRLQVFSGIILEPEVHLGVLWMFAEEGFDELAEEENECHWGVGGAASLALSPRWSIRAESRWSHVLTRTPIDRVVSAASLGYTFDTPPWLAQWFGS